MARRLTPILRQRRARFRLTWPTLVLPFLAVVLIARGERIRSPFSEREADLALAAQPARAAAPAAERPAAEWNWTPAVVAIAAAPARLLTTGERPMRLFGVLAGALALAMAVVLGERLFATRVGLLAAILLLVLPPGRTFLGSALGPDPFFLLAMLVALTAIRDFDASRRAGWVAGSASGFAIALAGSDAAWLPTFALAWLWANRGIEGRGLVAIGAGTLAGAALATLLAQLVGPGAGGRALEGLLEPQLGPLFRSPAATLRTLLALAPIALLGVAHMPDGWQRNPSLRFLLGWLAIGLFAARTGCSALPAWVAALFLAASLAAWGFSRSGLGPSTGALAASLALAIAFAPTPIERAGAPSIERWAVRETGRFLRRVVPADRRVGAVAGVRRRLSYYGRRPIEHGPGDEASAAVDYAVIDGETFRRESARWRHREESERPSMVAQFGPWIIIRTAGRKAAAGPAGLPGEALPTAPTETGDIPKS